MRAVFPAAVLACVFVASPLHAPLNNPNEGVRVFVAKALVEDQTFAIDDAVRAWGYIDDKSVHDGKLYSSKAPLASMVGALAYALVHPFTGDLQRSTLTRVCRGAMAAVSLAALLLLGRGLRRRIDDIVVADLIVAGVLFSVLASLNVLAGHAFAAIAPAAALLLVHEGGRRALACAGCLLAAAVGAEYPAMLAAVPIGVLGVVRAGGVFAQEQPLVASARAFMALLAGAAPVIVVVGVAHTAMFGAPWRTGYAFLENASYREVVRGTWFGIGAPHLDVLGAVTFSPSVGLFFYAPFLLVGVAWIGRMRRSEAVATALALLALMVFIAGFRGWRGGWSVGPRYISELIGLLAVPTALAFAGRGPVARVILAVLVAVTIVHAGIAGMFFPHLPELLANPVYEMMLPLVARGLAPDSVPLALGAAPPVSAVVLLVVLAGPLVAALASAGWRTLAAGMAAAGAALAVLVAVGPQLARTTPPASAALEARRMLDNWRPERGNPLLDDDGERMDPRHLVAVDRARAAFARARVHGCAGPLVVVADDLALHLNVSAPLLMVTARDVARANGPLPCRGTIVVMGTVPPPLRGLAEIHRDDRVVWLARE
jgi:hypothetical protein